ncbi:hypothetical protein BHE74_00020887 [Ensete ventricosum]|nr:hypothetical protein BHE74_00020887 [Ensete ventricosum]
MGVLYLWEGSLFVRLALPLSSLGHDRVVRWTCRCSGMGRGRGVPYGINGAWSWVVLYPSASTSDAQYAANLVAWTDMASSQALMWLFLGSVVAIRHCLDSRGLLQTSLTPALVGNFMIRWYVETTALSLLSVGLPMMALYAEGSATTMNDTNSVFDFGSPPMVAPAYPFFWMSPRVVPGACHLGTSYDLPASLPPKFLRLYTSSPVATSLVPEAIVGLGQELAMKLSSNSLAKWLKDEMEDGFNRLYHIRAGPLRVVGKRLLRNIRMLVHQRLRQLGNVGDDGLDHPDQRLDLLGETKECLGCHNGRPEVRWGRSESWSWGSESQVIKQPPVTIWCRWHRARFFHGKVRSLSSWL